jgi:CRISPR-associated protein Cmr3
MQAFLIRCTEPLFFRDARTDSTRGLFPPPPSVVRGALRTAYFATDQGQADFHKRNTDQDPTNAIRLGVVLPTDAEYIFLPAAADLVKQGNSYKLLTLKNTNVRIISDDSFSYSLTGTSLDKVNDAQPYFWGKNGYSSYLKGKVSSLKTGYFKNLTQYITYSSKLGIGLNRKTGNVAEGRLFEQERVMLHNGPNKLAFYVEVDLGDLVFPTEGKLSLGAEGTPAIFHAAKTVLFESQFACPDIEVDEVFKILLLSPAFFQDDLKTYFNQQGLELLAYASDKPIPLGGFDLQKGIPKPLRMAMPAGTVFFVKATTPHSLEEAKKLHGHSICKDDDAANGFGIVHLAKCYSQPL